MNTAASRIANPFVFRRVKVSVFTIIKLLPSFAYLSCLVYLYETSDDFNYIVNIPNLIYLVSMTLFPNFMLRCETLSCSLFLLRTMKEVWNVESPTKLYFDNFELFITSLSSWLFEGAFWFTLLVKFVVLMIQVIKAYREYEFGGTNNPIREEDKRYMDELPSNEYQVYQKQCERSHVNIRKDCAICLEVFKQNDEIIAMTKCDHVFHEVCIRKWFLVRTNCPYCRTDVLPEKQSGSEEDENNFHISDLFIVPRLEIPVPTFVYPTFRFYS